MVNSDYNMCNHYLGIAQLATSLTWLIFLFMSHHEIHSCSLIPMLVALSVKMVLLLVWPENPCRIHLSVKVLQRKPLKASVASLPPPPELWWMTTSHRTLRILYVGLIL